jgi:hypothetical protein
MTVLPSTPLKVGLMTLPSATIPVHLTDGTRAFLDSVLLAIPEGKRGSARLVIDWKQTIGATVDTQIGAHLTHVGPADVDVAAGAGWSQQQGGYAGALIRVEWD